MSWTASQLAYPAKVIAIDDQLGIKGAERVQYWKLWLWTLFHRPRLFPQAIELAIVGYHFRRVCELQG